MESTSRELPTTNLNNRFQDELYYQIVNKLGQGGYTNAWLGNVLQAASYKGYEAIVKLLLDKGADVNAQGKRYGNALHAALEGGHEAIAKLLLDHLEQRPILVPDFSREGDNFSREDDDDSDIKVVKEKFKSLARSLRTMFVVNTKKRLDIKELLNDK